MDAGLLVGTGKVHHANDLVRRIGLDEPTARRIESGQRVTDRPVAVGRQKISRQPLAKNRVVEGDLLGEEELRALQHPSQGAAPIPANAGRRGGGRRPRN